MEGRIQEVLQDCIELLRKGMSLEQCLARYPEHAYQLEPLLRTAVAVEGQLTPGMSSEARTRLRARIMAEWDRHRQPRQRRWSFPRLVPRWAAVAVSVVIAILLGSVGTVAAASSAVPGDPLYPVKEVREEAQLWFARSPEAKVSMYTRLVKERTQELRELVAKGQDDSSPVPIALARLERHIADVGQLVEESVEQPGDDPSGASAGLVERLQEMVVEQRSAEVVLQESLQQLPASNQAELRRSLQAIQQGRDRVHAALETLGHTLPPVPTPAGGGDAGPDSW